MRNHAKLDWGHLGTFDVMGVSGERHLHHNGEAVVVNPSAKGLILPIRKWKEAVFSIKGNAPLVVHRFHRF